MDLLPIDVICIIILELTDRSSLLSFRLALGRRCFVSAIESTLFRALSALAHGERLDETELKKRELS